MTVKRIHESDLYGCFIETGCGMPLSNILFSEEGCSNTVHMAESPYSKEYQKERYGDFGERSVSFEAVKNMVDHWKSEFSFVLYKEKITPKLPSISRPINLIYVSSFQVGSDKVCHGWIGIAHKEKTFYCHVTLDPILFKTRQDQIDKIGNIGLRLLESILDESSIPTGCWIDIIKDNKGDDLLVDLFSLLAKEEMHISIKNGKLCRLEDLFRDQETIIMYKGSFNPIHNAHQTIAELAEARYESKTCFMINLDTYQKGQVAIDDLLNRIKNLSDLGFSIIVSKSGFFRENVECIRSRFKNKKMVFVLGTDTMNRLIESSYQSFETPLNLKSFNEDFAGVRFFVINRKGFEIKEKIEQMDFLESDPFEVSSTMIRKLKEENKHEEIKSLIPEKIYKNYLSQ